MVDEDKAIELIKKMSHDLMSLSNTIGSGNYQAQEAVNAADAKLQEFVEKKQNKVPAREASEPTPFG